MTARLVVSWFGLLVGFFAGILLCRTNLVAPVVFGHIQVLICRAQQVFEILL